MHDRIFEQLDPTKPIPGIGAPIYPGRAQGALWVMAKLFANASACPQGAGGQHMNRGDGLCGACGQPAAVRGIDPLTLARAMATIDPEIRSVWDVVPVVDWLERQGAIRLTHAAGMQGGVRLYEIVPEQGLMGAGSSPLGGPSAPASPPGAPPGYPGPGAPYSPTAPVTGLGGGVGGPAGPAGIGGPGGLGGGPPAGGG